MIFLKRLTCPTKDNKFYINPTYSPFINSPYDMFKNGGNCVAYVFSRWAEILNKKPNLPSNNAENWYQDAPYSKGNTPKVGAIICWRQGQIRNGKDGAGHVAIVEEIKEDGTIVTSNSGYKTKLFYLQTLKPPYILKNYQLEGFIYLHLEFENQTEIKSNNNDIQYRVHIKGGNWLEWVSKADNTNQGYAGIYGKTIDCIQIKDKEYQVHNLNGNWLAPINGYNDINSNGYAGIFNKSIDGLKIYDIQYRVHIKGGNWLEWVNKVDNTNEGYAGIYGKEIDGIQIKSL